MSERHKRVLIYSHDTFGLGHLRRCRAIAHALVEADKDLSVLILSGSPIIGSFDFRARVDFVRVPGVIKLRNGEYTSLNLHIAIEEMLEMRASIIQHTADIFDPDLFIVDKEPLGLRGEVEPTLDLLRRRGIPLVLGLRDVMAEPAQLARHRVDVLVHLVRLRPGEGRDEADAKLHRPRIESGPLSRAARRTVTPSPAPSSSCAGSP